jgi:large subunit ribosomal protein L24
MSAKLKIKKGDRVIVISGADRGKRGEVLKVIPDERRVLVAGVNLVKRHTKQSAKTQGGVITKEAPVHVSNVALADPKTQKPTRVGFKILADGTKVRIAKKSGEVING